MMSKAYDYAFVGGMRQDYCITHDGQVFVGMLGGNAVFAAVGAAVWSASTGIISRVGSDYPRTWLEDLRRRGINVDGVRILPDPQDTRTFYAYLSPEERVDTNPASHFLRVGHPLPKELIGYQTSTNLQESREAFATLAVRPADITEQVAHCRGVHFSPADFLTHLTVPHRMRELGVPLVTLDPSLRYMDPRFRLDLPVILCGLDAFLPSESEAMSFFHREQADVWEMAEGFGVMGCHFVVIKRGARGQCLWDCQARRRWQVPAFPAQVRDVTGAGDAFCGAFMITLSETGDPLEAALRGSVSASLVVEGTGALFALEALSGLAQARLEALRPAAKRV